MLLHVGIAFGQDATGAGQMRSHECSEFYRSEGWKVPGLEGAKASDEQSSPEAKSEIRLRVLKPAQAEGALTLVRCPADSPGRVEINEVPVKVLQLLAYGICGFPVCLQSLLHPRDISRRWNTNRNRWRISRLFHRRRRHWSVQAHEASIELEGTLCAALSCRIGFGEVRRRDSRTEEHAAFGIGFRVDTSPRVGSCTATLGCRRVT